MFIDYADISSGVRSHHILYSSKSNTLHLKLHSSLTNIKVDCQKMTYRMASVRVFINMYSILHGWIIIIDTI